LTVPGVFFFDIFLRGASNLRSHGVAVAAGPAAKLDAFSSAIRGAAEKAVDLEG
jgi:hypothetical protein